LCGGVGVGLGGGMVVGGVEVGGCDKPGLLGLAV